MSSEVECEAIVVIEDELEEGEISDKTPVTIPRKRDVPLRYRLNKFDSRYLKSYKDRSRTKSLFRKSRNILAKASRHHRKPYVCKAHRKLLLHPKPQLKRVQHVSESWQAKPDKHSITKHENKQLSDHSVSKRSSNSNHTMQFSSCEFSNNVRLHENRHEEKNRGSCEKYDKMRNSTMLKRPNILLRKFPRKTEWYSKARNFYPRSSRANFRNKSRRNLYSDFNGEIDIDVSYEELLEKYKYIQSELANLEHEDRFKRVSINGHRMQSSSSCEIRHFSQSFTTRKRNESDRRDAVESVSDVVSSNAALNTKITVHITPDVKQDKLEEEDDTELKELRLQALASRSRPKNNVICPADHRFNLSDDGAVANKENMPSEFLQKYSAAYSVSEGSDNYEVLDMDEGTNDDVDMLENSQSSSISNCQHISENNEQVDLEAEHLRAQVLASMNVKKSFEHLTNGVVQNAALTMTPGVANSTSTINDDFRNNQMQVNSWKKITGTGNSYLFSMNQTVSTFSRPLAPNVVLQEKITSGNKSDMTYLNFYPRKHPLLPYPKQAPLVITLADDSSDSEENSETEELDMSKRAAIASLERLIDSAKNDATLAQRENSVPKPCVATSCVVDCLPEAQQQEYNKLKGIIAKKETQKEESTSNASLDAYTLLINKLKLAESMILTENKILKMAKTRSNEKKAAFITSQVEVRRLQEQLDAAIKVKEVNKKLMFDANAQLRTIQTSVNRRTVLIRELRKECTKLGKQVFGDKFSTADDTRFKT